MPIFVTPTGTVCHCSVNFCQHDIYSFEGVVNVFLTRGHLVENDPPWDACAGEVTPHDMCECVCVGVYVVPLVCARQNRFNPRFRVK